MLEDEIALLSTTYVPGVLETAGIKACLEAQMDEMRAIGQEIATLEARIVNLKAHRTDLEKRCAVGEALLAPIRKIPTEILEEIFVQSIPWFFLDDLEFGLAAEDPFRPGEEHPHDARARLGEVCRKWRNVSQTAPRVWSTISLDRRLPPDISIVDKWLRTSRSCPLDLYIRPHSWFKDNDRSHFPDIFLLLRREIPRLRCFIARLTYHDEIHPLFPPYGFTEAPNMGVFGVLGEWIWTVEEGEYPGTGTIHAPKLQSIILSEFEGMLKAFTDTSFSTLQRLTTSVKHKPSSFYLPTLALCGNLEFLHFTEHHDSRNDTVGPLHAQVTLSALTQMTFLAADTESTPELFGSIRVPALENLTFDPSCFHAPPLHPPAAGMLRSLLQDSFSSLGQLILWNVSLSGPETGELFNQLVNLDTICIFYSCLEPPLFDALNSRTNTSAAACPRLVKLRIVDCQYPFFDFVDFIRHRTQPDIEERSPGYLTSVEVEACSLEAEHTMELLALQQTHGSTLHLTLR